MYRDPHPYEIGKCTICGKEFTYLKAAYSGKYCSNACKHQSFRKPDVHETKTCLKCGKVFTSWVYFHQKYCSRKCYGRTYSPITKKCVICNKEFITNPARAKTAIACSTVCQNEWQRKFRPKRILDCRNRLGRKGWKRIRQEIIERDGYACRSCGNSSNLHVHHIVPWVIGHDDSADNLITLCVTCHFIEEYPHRRWWTKPESIRETCCG